MTTRSANEIWVQAVTGEWRPVGLLAALMRTFTTWHERARERNVLASLDERCLHDMGLTASDVWKECSKPFWRE